MKYFISFKYNEAFFPGAVETHRSAQYKLLCAPNYGYMNHTIGSGYTRDLQAVCVF